MLSKSAVYKKFKNDESISEAGLDLHYQTSELNHQFYSGDEAGYRVGVTTGKKRKIVIFNRIKPMINSITGFMIKLRRKPAYLAKEFNEQIRENFTDNINAYSDYLRDDANIAQVETRQDKEMLITGVGAVDNSISYLKNPFGEIMGVALRFDEVGWDPQARATNLLDARYVYRRKVMNREDASDLFSADEDEFEAAESPLISTSTRNKLYAATDSDVEDDLVQVFSYQWWQYENYYRIDNPIFEEGIIPFIQQELLQAFELLQADIEEENENSDPELIDDLFSFDPRSPELIVTSKTRKIVKALLEEFGLEIEEVKHKRKTFYTAIISGKKVFSHFKSQDQNGFTIKFKTGDYDESRNIWHGVVDQLREPSRYANKALTEILYVIAANSKGGVMYEKSAVSDSKRFEAQWATTDAAIRVNDDAISGGKIQAKAQSALPSGYENVLAAAKAGMFETSGINPEFLGSSENKQVSALLETQRIEQVTSTLATYFDSITLAGKETAGLYLTYMRVLGENNPVIQFQVFKGDGTSQPETLNNQALMAEYGIDIKEVPTTPAQKAENFAVMKGFADSVALVGINIYGALVEDLPISQSQKERIRKELPNKELTPEQMQAQQEQQALVKEKAFLDLTEQKVDIGKKEAEMEKIGTDAEQNIANTGKAKAETVKTIQEAEQVDIENDQLALATRGQVSFVI